MSAAEGTGTSNTMVLLLIVGGLYYLSTTKRPTGDGKADGKRSPEAKTGFAGEITGGAIATPNGKTAPPADEDEEKSYAPLMIVAFLLYSLRKEIEETITRDRVIVLVSILASNYITSVGGSFVQSSGAAFAGLVMLPAIQNE